jgi:GT2 family glycosyltransferase
VISHVGGSTTGGRHSNFSLYHGHRNLVWTFVKNMPSFLFWFFLPAHILLNFISLLWFTFNGRGRIIFKAKIDAIKGLRSQIHKRAEIQRMRKAKLFTIFNILNKGFIK